MFATLRNALKVKEIRTKLLNMLIVMIVVRIGTVVPVPGIDLTRLATDGNVNSTIYQLIAGGNYGTIFAMGIGPYINASIIMQLLTVAIPKLEQLQKDGEEGRKKISQYTRIAAVILALLQGCGQIYTVHSAYSTQNFWMYAIGLLTMVTGTVFIMWLGEKLTEVGIGNGASFIIFVNILDNLDTGVMALYTAANGAGVMGVAKVVAILVFLLAVMVFVIFVQDGERRIPVQYSRKMAGKRVFGGQSTFIPIKVNIAGVMSIIFAISLLQFPSTINQLFNNDVLTKISNVLSTRHPVGALIYVILIFAFTFFYTSFAFNPVEVADNMKKSGGFVPGIRPGKPTSDYIQKIVDRISMIGAITYALIALVPIVIEWVTGVQMGFGGTTLLIVTGVALEIIKQLESQLLIRHYKGFLA
jgi:preprotein translocase subunit SecY